MCQHLSPSERINFIYLWLDSNDRMTCAEKSSWYLHLFSTIRCSSIDCPNPVRQFSCFIQRWWLSVGRVTLSLTRPTRCNIKATSTIFRFRQLPGLALNSYSRFQQHLGPSQNPIRAENYCFGWTSNQSNFAESP